MPDVRLGVEIDNARVVEVMPIAYGASGTMDLAAIERGQRRAVVKLFVLRGSKKHELTTINVRDLPAFPNRRALLRLRTNIDRSGELRVRLDVEDRLYHDERIDVRRHLRRSGRAVAAAVVALLLLAGAAYLLFVGLRPGEAPVARGGPEAEAAEEAHDAEPEHGTAGHSEPGQSETSPETPGDPAAPTDEPESRDAEPADEAATAGAAERTDEAATAGAAEPADQSGPAAGADTQPEAGEPPAEEPEPTPEPAAEPAEWSVYFTPDSPALTPRARERLTEIADRLSSYGEDTVISIIGHTALAGTERGRYDLSLQRAENVFAYLESAGWQPQQDVTVQGVGGDEPVTRDPERQELNRRVEINATP